MQNGSSPAEAVAAAIEAASGVMTDMGAPMEMVAQWQVLSKRI